jgi:hypothetical protein
MGADFAAGLGAAMALLPSSQANTPPKTIARTALWAMTVKKPG